MMKPAVFFRTPFLIPFFYPTLIWRIPTRRKKIYLTFDDGPVSGPTDFALATLEEYNAKATFFCIGKNVLKNPELFGRITEQKHQIGNHTFSHLKGTHHSPKEYYNDVQKGQNVIQNTALFRPPYGRIKPEQIRLLYTYRIIMWDVLTFDFMQSMTAERCLRGAIRATRPGSIVVFHDSYKAEKNMRFVLPRYLDYFKTKGFVFETIPNLST